MQVIPHQMCVEPDPVQPFLCLLFPQDAVLDFFGAAVKAQELLAHCAQVGGQRGLGKGGRWAWHCPGLLLWISTMGLLQPVLPSLALPQMRTLARRVEAAGGGQRFKLDPGAQLPAARWGKALGWGPADDAALLVGEWALMPSVGLLAEEAWLGSKDMILLRWRGLQRLLKDRNISPSGSPRNDAH